MTSLGVTKLIINEQDVVVRTGKKVKYTPLELYGNMKELGKLFKDTITKYKEIIFDPDTPVCMVCLDKLRKQQVTGKKVYDQSLIDDKLRKLAWDRLQKNIVMDGDTMIDGRTSELLDPDVDSTWFLISTLSL